MIRVEIFVDPHGDMAAARPLGRVEIANVTRCPGRLSQDYLWRVSGQNARREPISACGYLVDSTNRSAMELVAEALAEWRSGRPLPMDNHGQAGLPEGIEMSAAEVWSRLDALDSAREAG